MLISLLFGLLGYIILCSITQIFVTSTFARLFHKHVPPTNTAFPPAAIVLAIRGSDPSLDENVRALLRQNYPAYKLFVVVDHIEDPAWDIVGKIREEFPERMEVRPLKTRLDTCSLKCSALAQALTELDASYEVVAFVDGDVLVNDDWLRGLVGPLTEPGITVATGNRWYVPADASVGSMSRYFWNVGVVIQLWMHRLVWPGSMALRKDAIEEMDLVSALRTSLFDGPTIVRQLRRHKMRAQFLPNVMIANREQISLQGFTSWVERQTIVVGSEKKRNWYLMALNALHICICVFIPPLAVLVGSTHDDPTLISWAMSVALMYWGVMSLSVVAIERCVRAVLRTKHKWFGWRSFLSAAPGLLLAHLVPVVALLRASIHRTVQWRGVTYEIRGPDDVRMLNYAPFRERVDPGRSVL